MSNEFPELDQVEITVSESTRERHRSAIGSALSAQRRASRGRRRVFAYALVLVLLVPVVALASQEAVPGDLLYPIKRLVEPVVQIFDEDASAERRVRELEVLFERDAPLDVIDRQIDIAQDVVTDRQPHLRDRIDQVIHDLDLRRTDLEGEPARDSDHAPSDSPDTDSSVVPDDRVTDSDTHEGDGEVDTDTTITTTDSDAGDGRARDG